MVLPPTIHGRRRNLLFNSIDRLIWVFHSTIHVFHFSLLSFSRAIYCMSATDLLALNPMNGVRLTYPFGRWKPPLSIAGAKLKAPISIS